MRKICTRICVYYILGTARFGFLGGIVFLGGKNWADLDFREKAWSAHSRLAGPEMVYILWNCAGWGILALHFLALAVLRVVTLPHLLNNFPSIRFFQSRKQCYFYPAKPI